MPTFRPLPGRLGAVTPLLLAGVAAATPTSTLHESLDPQFTPSSPYFPDSDSTEVAVPAADRAAILSMAGSFRVQFDFRETVATEPGYVPAEPYAEQAVELVTVVADEGDFISLQHVLVVGAEADEPMVVKHWRQDWRFEDTEVLAYRGHQRWVRERLPLESVRGTWSQSVFQTTDAPRYEAIGRWSHEGGRSSWESHDTLRPLPRREHTTRSDYDVVGCRNRHTITPDGWVHEQDNRKLQLDDAGSIVGCLVHEIGLNRYIRCDPALVESAARYWDRHAAAWADVRSAWTQVLDRDEIVVDEGAGPPLPRLVSVALENDEIRRSLVERLQKYVGG